MMLKHAYAPLFRITDLSRDDEVAAVRFATHIAKLAISGDTAGLECFVKEAFAGVCPEALAELTALAQVFVNHGTATEKRAFSPMMSGLQASLAALPMKELQKLREQEAKRSEALAQALAEVVKTHPHLASDPKTLAEHFDVMARFAPDVASSSVLSGNILSQLHKLGPGALTHQMISELRKIQEGMDAERQNRVKQTIDAVSPFTRLPS